MTAIQGLGTAVQIWASVPKGVPVGAIDASGSFATLLDELTARAAPEYRLAIGANVRNEFPLHLPAESPAAVLAQFAPHKSEDAHQDLSLEPETAPALPIATPANALSATEKGSVSISEIVAAPVSTPSALLAKIADANDLVPVSASGFHAREIPKLFAFAELGMFGRHGAQFVGESEPKTSNESVADLQTLASTTAINGTQVEMPSAPSRDPVATAIPDLDAAQLAYAPRPLQQVSAETIQPPPPVPEQQTVGLPPAVETVSVGPAAATNILNEVPVQRSAILEPVSGPKLGLASESEFQPVEEGGAPPLPSELPESPNPSSLNIVISGPNDALSIVARNNDAEPAMLRKLAESTAAEFGMHVTEVRINGSAVEPSFSPASGGNHGRRAR